MSEAVTAPIRVLIADDQAPLRQVVASTLTDDGFDVCWQATDAVGAVEGATTTRPDVCLLDVRMPGSGIAAARIIADEVPSTRIVMLTVSRDTNDFLDALRAGAAGYVLKDVALSSLDRALRAVLDGQTAIPRELTGHLVDSYRHKSRKRIVVEGQPVKLSEREWEILELLAEGLSTAEIAARVFVAPVTVRSHVSSLFKKLRVSSREEAVDRMLG